MPRMRSPSSFRRSLNSQKAPQPRVGRKRAQCFCKLELRLAVHEGALSHFHCAISSAGGVASRKSKFAERHVPVHGGAARSPLMFTALLYFHLVPATGDE